MVGGLGWEGVKELEKLKKKKGGGEGGGGAGQREWWRGMM